MKILFQSRTNLFSAPGGDTIQILKTKEYLEKLGCKIEISLELKPAVKEFDIIHLFNLMAPQELMAQIQNAKDNNKPVALSTIYGLYTEFERKARGGIGQLLANILNPYHFEYIKTFARYYTAKNVHPGVLLMIRNGYYNSMKYVAENTNVFLPNSESEMSRVAREFKLHNYTHKAVPNAVDLNIFNFDDVKIDPDLLKYKDCILCAARIEGRKSQLNLIRAVKDSPYQLVLVGNASPNQKSYIKKVKNEAGKNVHIIGSVSHDKLAMFYKLAKVHALISWMETPGLSSLEAGVMKANIVITKKGDTQDYFKEYAFYCEPDDIKSIRKAIDSAFNTPFSDKLYNHIRRNFIWEKTAAATLEGYKLIKN